MDVGHIILLFICFTPLSQFVFTVLWQGEFYFSAFSLGVFVELCYLRKGHYMTSVLAFIIFSIATHFKTMYCILQIVCIFWVPVQISFFCHFKSEFS